METTKILKAGYVYTVTATTECTVSTPDGLVITTVIPGKQGSFVAPTDEVVFSDPHALVTASFKGASVAVAGGGGDSGADITIDQNYSGASANAQSGVAVAQAIGRVDTYVMDYGTLTTALDLSGYVIDTESRTAATDELWLAFGGSTYQVTWPDTWIWLEGAEPAFSTNTSYCICVRSERGGHIIANVAYEY